MKRIASRRTVVASLATAGLALTGAAVVAPGAAQAATGAGSGEQTMTSYVLLSLDEVTKAGSPADTAATDSTGNATLLSASRRDRECLSDKTMRAITGSKSAPEPGSARAYYDGLYTSTASPAAAAQVNFLQGYSAQQTTSWVTTLRQGIQTCKPTNGHYYGSAQHATNGSSTVEYYLEYDAAGRVVGGAGLTRNGDQLAYVALFAGSQKTLVNLGFQAGSHLYLGQCPSSTSQPGTVHPDGC